MKRLINPLLLVMLLVLSCKEEKQVVRHQCNWEDCELVGQTTFHSTWGYEPYTDGWCVEKCHWEYPGMTYEQCEDWVIDQSKDTITILNFNKQ